MTTVKRPRPKDSRPYVILNAAMSLDGKIATRTGESRISSAYDLKRVHRLRSQVDGIMVGIGTVLLDDPKLTVKYFHHRNPSRIIVDSKAQTPLRSHIVKTAKSIPTIVAVTSHAPPSKLKKLEEIGVKTLRCGDGTLVSLPVLMKRLYKRGIRRLLLEGGGTLNWGMLSKGLVDKISLTIGPMIIGGDATTVVDGLGFSSIAESLRLRLDSIQRKESELVVTYTVLG